MVVVNKEKMSKSLKNFFTMSELLKRYDGEVIRLYLITISYHKPLNFDMESLEQARKNYEYFNESKIKLNELAELNKSGAEIEDSKIAQWRKGFEDAMDSDFNTANVLALLFEIFKFSNANILSLSSNSAKKINALLSDIFSVLGFERIGQKRETINLSFKDDLLRVLENLMKNSELSEKLSGISKEADAPEILKQLLGIRFEFRKQKRFDISDLIRDELKKIGVVLEDSKDGTKYKLVMTDERK